MTESALPPEAAPPGPLTRLLRDQRVAFMVVGAIKAAVGFGIFVVCSLTVGDSVDLRFGQIAGSLVTPGITHVLAVLFAFVMQRQFVFRVHGHLLRDLARYWSVYLAAAAVNFAALPVLVGLGLDRIPAQAVIARATALVSYFGHRIIPPQQQRRRDLGWGVRRFLSQRSRGF
ncbi:MAG: GtrA family protein [Mycobacterium sp.]